MAALIPGRRDPATPRPPSISLRRSLGYFVPSYLVAILGYLALNAVVARLLGPAGFASFVVLLTLTTLVGQLGLLGVHRSGVREAARAERPDEVAELLHGVKAVLGLPLPLASLGCSLGIWAWQGFDATAAPVALLCGVLVYESGYQLVAVSYLRGMGQLRVAALLSGRSGGALVAVAQTVFVLFVAVLFPDSGLTGVLVGTVVGYALPLLWAGRHLRLPGTAQRPAAVRRRDLLTVVRRDWRFTVSQSGGFLNSTVELWLAAALLPPVAASLFVAAQRLARLLIMPATSLQIVFSPAISRLSGQARFDDLESLVRTAATLTTAVSGVLWIPMVVRPGDVLGLVFGSGFAAAGSLLALIATAYLLNGVSGMSGTTLSMSHFEGDNAAITWCVVGARLVLGALAVQLWGVLGLAVSSAAVSVLFYLTTWAAVRRRLHISTHVALRPRVSMLAELRG